MQKPSYVLLCEERIGYEFADRALIERALTHRSWAHERAQSGRESEVRNLHNEAFEFVGDSVLGLIIAEILFERFPNASEGELTLMKHRLVSATTLSEIAERLRLSEMIRLGRGEERTGGRKKSAILSDTLEAVFAAVFFDGGYGAAKEVVHRLFTEHIENSNPTASLDYKTMLQERLQAEKRAAPVYSVVRTEGPPHRRTFFVEAVWDGGREEGTGTTIKNAEMMAAKAALNKLEPPES
ncbi:MAG: ribonuclease III [Acidobacteriota bacterium]|nr:ribonuclease III [Acidobacteriota bacterium]